MRILFVVPHYFSDSSGASVGLHGSTDPIARDRRCSVLRQTVWGLHQTFGVYQGILRIVDRANIPANQSFKHDIRIVFVTNGRDHLLAAIDSGHHYQHIVVDERPEHLGFAAHAIMRERFSEYDFVGYLEDDLWIHDPLFFHKLVWFGENTGDQNLLLPNRFEHGRFRGSHMDPLMKCFVDGDLAHRVTESFQNVNDQPEYLGKVMGMSIRWVRTLNPHSGCFFLNQNQARRWAHRPDFESKESSFIGPLESAATLSVARMFRIYKPAPENASFLEVEHGDRRFIFNVNEPDFDSYKSSSKR